MLVSSVALGGIAGLLLGGDWRNLRSLRIHWWPLAILALAIRVAALIVGFPLAAHVTAILLTSAIAARNWRIAGAVLIALGSAMNAVVILLNGGMPFDAEAAASVGAQALQTDSLHHHISPATKFPWLADVIPVAPFRAVYSVGDVVIAAGGFWIPFAALRRK